MSSDVQRRQAAPSSGSHCKLFTFLLLFLGGNFLEWPNVTERAKALVEESCSPISSSRRPVTNSWDCAPAAASRSAAQTAIGSTRTPIVSTSTTTLAPWHHQDFRVCTRPIDAVTIASSFIRLSSVSDFNSSRFTCHLSNFQLAASPHFAIRSGTHLNICVATADPRHEVEFKTK